MNETKKQILIFNLNFMKEIPLKINDTKKSNSNNQLQFYEKNPIENQRQKNQILIIHFNFTKRIHSKFKDIKEKLIHINFRKEILLKMKDTKNRLTLKKEIPLKLTTQKNQILIIHFKFSRRKPFKNKRQKKSNFNNPNQFYSKNLSEN